MSLKMWFAKWYMYPVCLGPHVLTTVDTDGLNFVYKLVL